MDFRRRAQITPKRLAFRNQEVYNCIHPKAWHIQRMETSYTCKVSKSTDSITLEVGVRPAFSREFLNRSHHIPLRDLDPNDLGLVDHLCKIQKVVKEAFSTMFSKYGEVLFDMVGSKAIEKVMQARSGID